MQLSYSWGGGWGGVGERRGWTLIIILKAFDRINLSVFYFGLVEILLCHVGAEINVRGRIHQPFLESGETAECVVCPASTRVQREIYVLFSWLIGKLPRLGGVVTENLCYLT